MTSIRLQISGDPGLRLREAQEEAQVPFMELLRAQPNKLILGVDTRWIEDLVFNAYGVFMISYVTGPRQEIVLLEDLEDGQGHGASHRVAVVSDRRGLP